MVTSQSPHNHLCVLREEVSIFVFTGGGTKVHGSVWKVPEPERRCSIFVLQDVAGWLTQIHQNDPPGTSWNIPGPQPPSHLGRP